MIIIQNPWLIVKQNIKYQFTSGLSSLIQPGLKRKPRSEERTRSWSEKPVRIYNTKRDVPAPLKQNKFILPHNFIPPLLTSFGPFLTCTQTKTCSLQDCAPNILHLEKDDIQYPKFNLSTKPTPHFPLHPPFPSPNAYLCGRELSYC